MQLNPVLGNMYDDVDYTHNIIRGECPFDCIYCYMKKMSRKKIKAYHEPFHIVSAELKGEYPCGKRIFIGSATDMWMAPDCMISMVLETLNSEYTRCNGNLRFVFQTKKPWNLLKWLEKFPEYSTLIVTLETNRDMGYSEISKAQLPSLRYSSTDDVFYAVREHRPTLKVSITIEPILDFDVGIFTEMCARISPDYISIGAATLREYDELNLPKPSWFNTLVFVRDLRANGLTVKIKKNLLRLAPTKQRKAEMVEGFKECGAIMKWLEDKDGNV